MLYCKLKATGELIETRFGDTNPEQLYANNSGYPQEDLEVGVTTEEIAESWWVAQRSYSTKRRLEYPSIGNQLDKIYHEGIDAWKADMIKPVKDKYPKE